MLAELKSFTSSGNDPDFRDSHGASPLHIAAANGFLTVIEVLLDHHVTIDAQDDDCWQLIHAAACWGHPDAIELLVQSGADLNAKTKNGETPYDISEDVEVRERIMQLKFEMETKKGSQSNRLRRSHSQNTRSQSIRRTSIREKAQISQREAREEARLRQEKVETKLYDSEDELKQHSEANQNGLISSTEVDPQDIDISFLPLGGKDTLQKFKAKTACDILEQVEHVKKTSTFTLRCDNGDVPKDIAKKEAGLCAITDGQSQGDAKNHSKLPSSRTGGNGIVQTSETTSIIQQSPGQSVNVEIHVTVNTSPTYSASNQGTLADLKKQRSTERHRNSISSTSSQDANGKSVPQNGHYVTGACNFNNPPSPTIAPRKYRGDPLEIVGRKKKRGCCNVM